MTPGERSTLSILNVVENQRDPLNVAESDLESLKKTRTTSPVY